MLNSPGNWHCPGMMAGEFGTVGTVVVRHWTGPGGWVFPGSHARRVGRATVGHGGAALVQTVAFGVTVGAGRNSSCHGTMELRWVRGYVFFVSVSKSVLWTLLVSGDEIFRFFI